MRYSEFVRVNSPPVNVMFRFQRDHRHHRERNMEPREEETNYISSESKWCSIFPVTDYMGVCVCRGDEGVVHT